MYLKSVLTPHMETKYIQQLYRSISLLLFLLQHVTGAVCSFESPSHPPFRLSWFYLWVLYLITAGWWAAVYGHFTSWYKNEPEIRSAMESKRE